MEMNPWCFDNEDNPVPLDMHAELDDTAHFKNRKKWGEEIEFPQPFGRVDSPEEQYIAELDAKTGASLKLTILNPLGRIWTMVAGGGASVVFADAVADAGFGHELANYGEYSGAPNEEETYQYAKTIISLATKAENFKHGQRKALIIGGGIANFTDVAKTFKGISHAIKELSSAIKASNIKIWVRRGGPNYKAGLETMRSLGKTLGLPIDVYGPEIGITDVIPMAIDYIEQKDHTA
jgi:ATP citrate (pro-S)-lyase